MHGKAIPTLIVLLIAVTVILGSLSLLPLVTPLSNEWATTMTQIDMLHDLGYDGTGVTIGIVDTGVDWSHQEFDQTSFTAWRDTINHQSEYYDDDDHGTHLAGLLVSKSSFEGLFSGIHLQGIASNANLVIVKAIPFNQYLAGGGNDTTVAEGITFCVEHQVDIILLSLGSSPDSVYYEQYIQTEDAIQQAINKGIYVVVPAGNDGQDDDGDVCFPATLPLVISVGSLGQERAISSFSSKGHQYPTTTHPHKKPELVAPGEGVIAPRINSAYGALSGTSQAAAYVTGILALLLEAYPEYKPGSSENLNATTITFMKDVLTRSAQKVGNLNTSSDPLHHDDWYGYGLIRAFEAYEELAKY